MKTSKSRTAIGLVLAAGLLALAPVAPAAFAEDQATPAAPANPGPGKWHKAEWQHMTKQDFEKKAAERFKAADTNHDGVVTFDEYRAYVKAEMERRREDMLKRRFEEMNTSKTGKLTEAEAKAAADQMYDRMQAMRKEWRQRMHDHHGPMGGMGPGPDGGPDGGPANGPDAAPMPPQ